MKNRNDFSRRANYCMEIQGELSNKANYHSKNRTNQNNRCHKNMGKFCQNIVSSEISLKSHKNQEFCQNLVALLLHNTVITLKKMILERTNLVLLTLAQGSINIESMSEIHFKLCP